MVNEKMSVDELLDVVMSDEEGIWVSKALACQYINKKFEAAQQSVHLTAYWRWLWVSICINIVLLLVVASTFGGR